MLLPAIWLPPAQNKQQKTGEAMSSIHRPSAPSTGFAFVAMFLVTLMLVMHQPVHCQAAPAAPTAAATVDEGQLKSAVLGDAGFLASNVFSFWQQHGLDSEYGGFHGTLDRAGTAVAPTSNLLALEGHNSADTPCLGYGKSGSPIAQQMAASAFDFVVQHIRDPADGLWYFSVSRDGQQVVDGSKAPYQTWFVLYGFSQYFQAFGNSTARDLALSTFKAMDAAWHNSDTGGYNEGGSGGKRTLNVLMHGVEALTALHRISGDGTVLSRLLELLDILCTRLGRSNGLLHEEYTPAGGKGQWSPTGNILYGHNLETAWVVSDTLDHLAGAISAQTAQAYRSAALSFGAAAARDGYDSQHGGVYESPSSKTKIWWVQNEAMLGLWTLHKHLGGGAGSGSSAKVGGTSYLQQLAGTSKFLRQHQTDNAVAGEQFWQVDADGSFRLTGDQQKDTKGNTYKASYHSSRAPLFLQRWVK